MFFQDEVLNPSGLVDRRLTEVLEGALERASEPVRLWDVMIAILAGGATEVVSTVTRGLAAGTTLGHVVEILEFWAPRRSGGTMLEPNRRSFAPLALTWLQKLEGELTGKLRADKIGLELGLAVLLENVDPSSRQTVKLDGMLDRARVATALREQAKLVLEDLPPLFDDTSEGRLQSEEWTEAARTLIERAAARAFDLGYERLLPPHLFLALAAESEGLVDQLLRLQLPPDVSPNRFTQSLADDLRLGPAVGDARPSLTRRIFGDAMVVLLESAQRVARSWSASAIDSGHLLLALLEDPPKRLVTAVRRPPFELDHEKMKEQARRTLTQAQRSGKRETPLRLPAGLPPSQDLTYVARTEAYPAAQGFERYLDPMMRSLYRKTNNNVLITGAKGIGKTTLMRELARRAASGDIPFLSRKRFVWVDCADVPPAESEAKLRALLDHVVGRTDVVLCLDGLGPLLRAPSGGNHKVLLRAALKERRAQLVAVMAPNDFADLMNADHELMQYFSRVAVDEPTKDASIPMVEQAATELEKEFKVTIERRAVERAVVLSADFILSERLPVKAIKILRRVCEDLEYERTQKGAAAAAVSAGAVIKVVSEISSVPESTLAGIVKDANYQKSLAEAVIGQDEAVTAVAEELSLIKAGLNDPGKPASVLFFAGLTGVGKTELAKALASLYSAAKNPQVYTMANFTEAHAVSGIMGVPPGYVGHEQGGRLINDLNSDPYCVFLLDEAEKAHPDIWKPFLNLFDEAWVVDQRGVKAFADRAIFILTSNAGQEIISRMSQDRNVKMEAIIEEVRKALPLVRNEKSGQPVFSPEFLARIRRIIVFKPLTEQAMLGICEKVVARKMRDWSAKREKQLVVSPPLMQHIAWLSHQMDRDAGGKEGGRVVAKNVSALVDVKIQAAAKERAGEYERCRVIEVELAGREVRVHFRPGGADGPDDPARADGAEGGPVTSAAAAN